MPLLSSMPIVIILVLGHCYSYGYCDVNDGPPLPGVPGEEQPIALTNPGWEALYFLKNGHFPLMGTRTRNLTPLEKKLISIKRLLDRRSLGLDMLYRDRLLGGNPYSFPGPLETRSSKQWPSSGTHELDEITLNSSGDWGRHHRLNLGILGSVSVPSKRSVEGGEEDWLWKSFLLDTDPNWMTQRLLKQQRQVNQLGQQQQPFVRNWFKGGNGIMSRSDPEQSGGGGGRRGSSGDEVPRKFQTQGW
jgi:hypothetical protein